MAAFAVRERYLRLANATVRYPATLLELRVLAAEPLTRATQQLRRQQLRRQEHRQQHEDARVPPRLRSSTTASERDTTTETASELDEQLTSKKWLEVRRRLGNTSRCAFIPTTQRIGHLDPLSRRFKKNAGRATSRAWTDQS
eukprot:scaffold50699_cov31-Tisochrysis_lutea.AAC.2